MRLPYSSTTLIISESDPTWDAGLYRPVTVGDRVWLDIDGDGVQDVGEPGIANVTLELEVGGTPIGTVTHIACSTEPFSTPRRRVALFSPNVAAASSASVAPSMAALP